MSVKRALIARFDRGDAGRGRPALYWGGAVHDELDHARSLGLSVALGGAMGAAIGAATDHVVVWVAAGIAAYIVMTVVGSLRQKRGQEKSNGK